MWTLQFRNMADEQGTLIPPVERIESLSAPGGLAWVLMVEKDVSLTESAWIRTVSSPCSGSLPDTLRSEDAG
jgi:hypothetical protein